MDDIDFLVFCVVLIVIMLVVVIGPAYPAERALTYGIWTEHYSGDHTEGLDNHLIAFEYDGYTGAFFRNSYGKETGFMGYGLHTKRLRQQDWWLRGNAYAGALIGYGKEHPIHFGALSPGVYPTVSVGYKEYSLETGVMPTFWWVGLKVEF